MKYAIIALLLLFTTACENQEKQKEDVLTEIPTTPPSKSVEGEIPLKIQSLGDVKQAYEKTNLDITHNRYTSSSFTYNCNGERGGTVTYYLNDNKLRLIEHAYNEYSHNEAVDRYYVLNNQPYFIFYKHTTWQFDGEAEEEEGATKDDISEKRYYLINNSLTECLEKKYTTRSTGKATDPDGIGNKTVSCPPVNELLEDFTKLYENKDTRGKLECL
ncbi:hypothetical protein [Aequorivita echinoideorum]|uniref:Lipoprotein n=1 Tax=Aequorivita echinoideorum TaxID=1549647 RepID=A0ABS5S2W9_9FLAO|nr:hypothetical protein [Aequorivita echinoideorum]MBT0607553.1 hypothetical protein [Aequorivita echinoideorum]